MAPVQDSKQDNKVTSEAKGVEGSISLNMIKSSIRSSESGSSNGNQSDNSALVGFGNSMFGFNFDSEEGNSSPPNSEQNENSSDSDGDPTQEKKKESSEKKKSYLRNNAVSSSFASTAKSEKTDATVSDLTNSGTSGNSSDSSNNANNMADRQSAADKASASLQSIAAECSAKHRGAEGTLMDDSNERKRKADERQDDGSDDEDKDGEGYDSDNSSQNSKNPSKVTSGEGGKQGKKRLTNKKREERNAREKERSFRISKQINELRDLLSTGGVIVAKGTKSSVLTEAANYIRMLQQHQYRAEIERHQLIQQMQLIGSGTQGPQAASAIRHVAAQNGVWSLGNFGGVPPRGAVPLYGSSSSDAGSSTARQDDLGAAAAKVDSNDYQFIFNSCGVGMAVASMGGAFVDCNRLFTELSGYTKQELRALTIFNLTARQNLREAFDLISQMISPSVAGGDSDTKPIVLRGVMKHRNDLGIAMTLVKGEDGVAKCFCVTLVKNPTSPFDASEAVPVSFESVNALNSDVKEQQDVISQPTFTSGLIL